VTFADSGNYTAALSGTPAAGTAGTYPFTITASNGVLPNATQSFTLTVIAAPLAVTVVSPNGGERVFVNVPTTVRWNATGATSFDVALSRNGGTSFTNVAGCTGLPGSATSCIWTPSGAGTSTARIRVTASRGGGETASDASDANFSIITAAPSVTVTSPDTPVSWAVGAIRSITWSHNLGASSFVRIELSRNAGSSWEMLAPAVQNTAATSGAFSWTVTGPMTPNALMRISWVDGPASDVGNATFAIVAPTITVTAPNTNVSWDVGSSHNITWTHNLGTAESAQIEVSRNGGTTWQIVSANAPNTANTSGSFSWLVTGPVTATARVRVSWRTNAAVQDIGDLNFKIASRITVTAPNTALTWAAGSARTISWSHDYGAAQRFDLAFSADAGASWSPLASNLLALTATTGAYTGPMPTTLTTQGLIRVSPAGNPGDGDVSNVTFTLAAPVVTVTAPNINVNWLVGSSQNIIWSHNLGTAESAQIEVSRNGGTTWEIVSANAPNTANTSGSFSWLVTGPVTATARVRVSWRTNAAVQDIGDLNFKIASRITVTAPNTALTWAAGSRRTISWNHDYGVAQRFDLAFSADGGASWSPLASNVPAATATTGTYTGPMPATLTTQGLIRVSPAGNPGDGDVSNVTFTLAAPVITVTVPNANLIWAIGTTYGIAWTHNLGTAESVRIELSRNGGSTWTSVAAAVPNTGLTSGTLNWTATGPSSTAARIRVTWTIDGSVQDVSNVNFRIQ
jgi:hypothetical protein